MSGTLYIVTTPIGNLQDLTPRAGATFGSVDFIAAEDTRVTIKLLNHLGLKKPMVSYYEHNRDENGPKIISRLLAGESCALCTDAGVPAVSDPGEALVQQAHTAGVPVVPVPGASAAITALCVSGQPTARFVFEGFLPVNRRQRQQRLQTLLEEERTVIFYEAPHKLLRTLADLTAAFGGQRPITLCRELTKLHEEILPTTLAQAQAHYAVQPPRGEFVLVMAGAQPKAQLPPAFTLPQAVALANGLMQQHNLKPSEAAKQAAAESGYAKSEIYRCMQAEKQNDTVEEAPQ